MPSLATSTSQSVTQVLIWGGVLILAVVVLFGGLWYYRKRVLDTGEGDSGGMWTFDDLLRMRQGGQLTEEEYQSLRAALVAAYRGDKADSTGSGDPTPMPGAGLAGDRPDKNGPDFDLRKGPAG